MIRALGIPVEQVAKRLDGGHPNVLDVINDGVVNCVINTPEGGRRRRCRTASRSVAPPPSAASPASRRSTRRSAATEALLAGTQAFNVLPISEYRQPRA